MAWTEDWNGVPLLLAQRDSCALALASSKGWRRCFAGFAEGGGGVEDLRRYGELRQSSERADGDVVLIGEIDLVDCGGEFVLALGFGNRPAAAKLHARASLLRSFDDTLRVFGAQWQGWQAGCEALDESSSDNGFLYRASLAVIRTHDAKEFPGGVVASLSIPWGPCREARDTGGYHLVWARDLVEVAGSRLAAGDGEGVRSVLSYLAASQKDEGNWPQNMWADGTAYWHGIQLDETGFPILSAELAWRRGAIDTGALARFWPMIHRAAAFIASRGPATPEDRWEHNRGYSPSTLAVEIAALLAAGRIAEAFGERELAKRFRDVADQWNARIEDWTYVCGTDLARRNGVEGYYVWIRPPAEGEQQARESDEDGSGRHPRPHAGVSFEERASPDALALVRFGLRAADDPRILNTIRVIDRELRVETPRGPAWHRYTGDAYGEHDDGSCFDGSGKGRIWPLLTGERAHYELAAGRRDEARRLAGAIEAFAGEEGLLPEQVWDAREIPERGLFAGGPTGSSRPLVWAHAEYVKLLRSLRDGAVFDMPPFTRERYIR